MHGGRVAGYAGTIDPPDVHGLAVARINRDGGAIAQPLLAEHRRVVEDPVDARHHPPSRQVVTRIQQVAVRIRSLAEVVVPDDDDVPRAHGARRGGALCVDRIDRPVRMHRRSDRRTVLAERRSPLDPNEREASGRWRGGCVQRLLERRGARGVAQIVVADIEEVVVGLRSRRRGNRARVWLILVGAAEQLREDRIARAGAAAQNSHVERAAAAEDSRVEHVVAAARHGDIAGHAVSAGHDVVEHPGGAAICRHEHGGCGGGATRVRRERGRDDTEAVVGVDGEIRLAVLVRLVGEGRGDHVDDPDRLRARRGRDSAHRRYEDEGSIDRGDVPPGDHWRPPFNADCTSGMSAAGLKSKGWSTTKRCPSIL